MLLPVTGRAATPPVSGRQVKTEMVSMVEAGVAGDALPVLSVIAVMGLLGLLAILVIRRHPHLEVTFLWVSALVMLITSLLSIFSLGLYCLPASILVLLSAIGMRTVGEASSAIKG